VVRPEEGWRGDRDGPAGVGGYTGPSAWCIGGEESAEDRMGLHGLVPERPSRRQGTGSSPSVAGLVVGRRGGLHGAQLPVGRRWHRERVLRVDRRR